MKAILMIIYGAPSSLDEVDDFYKDIYHGNIPSAQVLEAGRNQFRDLGVCDPLYAITNRQATALQRRLKGVLEEDVQVYIGTRHTKPFISEAIDAILRDGADGVAVIPMSLLYSKTGIGMYLKVVSDELRLRNKNISVLDITHWCFTSSSIEILANRARAAWNWLPVAVRDQSVMIFTAHSKPGKPRVNRIYSEQFQLLAQAVALRAGISKWRLAYRSGGPAPQTWLGPDIQDVIKEEADSGMKGIATCELMSVTENVEVLRDMGSSAQNTARLLGMEFVRAEFLNDADDFMGVLADIIKDKIREGGWLKKETEKPTLVSQFGTSFAGK